MLVILIIVILCCLKHIQITKDWEFFLGYLRSFSPKVYEFFHISFREKFHNFRSLSFRSLSCQEFVLSGVFLSGVCLSGVCLSGVCHGTKITMYYLGPTTVTEYLDSCYCPGLAFIIICTQLFHKHYRPMVPPQGDVQLLDISWDN